MKARQDTERRAVFQKRIGAMGVLSTALLLSGLGSLSLFAQDQHRPAPIERRPPAGNGGQPQQNTPNNQRNQNARPAPAQARPQPETAGQRHLGEWLEQHQGLSLTQQQQALDREPGFTRLQPQVQQRMHERLQQLNTMTPQRRERAIERTEEMERLSPGQREQVRGAMRELGTLPPDRRRAVAQSFRELQQMPPQERGQYLNSPQMRAQFTEQERATLGNLVRVAPLLPNDAGPGRQR